MRRLKFSSFIFALLVLSFTFTTTLAQDETPSTDEQQTNSARQVRRPNLLRELGLTREQIQQIRRINQTNRPLIQEAQRRLREANRALDEAIYADVPNDFYIQERTKAVQQAQAEVIKNRTRTEFLIRKVLTPEQLVKFREMRSRLQQRLENRQNQPTETRPVNNLNRRRPL